MNVIDIISESVDWLIGDKVRLFLSILGIIISVSSIIVTEIIGGVSIEALKKSILDEEKGHALILSVSPTMNNTNVKYDVIGECEVPENVFFLENMLDEFENEFGKDIHKIYSYDYGEATYNKEQDRVRIVGCTRAFLEEENIELEDGAYFRENERYPFAIISETYMNKINMGKKYDLGDCFFIKINGQIIEIILAGIYSCDDTKEEIETIYVSCDYLKEVDTTIKYNCSEIAYRVEGLENIELCRTFINGFFDECYNNKDWFVKVHFDVDDLDDLNEIIQIILFVIRVIGYISFIVGGFCVANMMLVSVDERKAEMGIKRALGAKQSDIRNEVVIETILLVMSGVIIGIVLGCGIGVLITLSISNMYDGVFNVSKYKIPFFSIIYSGALVFVIGLGTTIWAVNRTKNYKIIDILREE